MDDKILRLPAVKEATGLSRSTIYQMVATGRFPKPFQITGARAVGWKKSEIIGFIDQKAEQRTVAK